MILIIGGVAIIGWAILWYIESQYISEVMWEIFVPKFTNGGKLIEVETHQEWDEKVRAISKGLTIFRSARGQWESLDGKVFIERMIPVRICCTRDRIIKIAKMTKDFYNQEVVFVYRVSYEKILVT